MYLVETNIGFCIYKNRSILDINKIDIYIESRIPREGDDLPQASITNCASPYTIRSIHTEIKTIMLINNNNIIKIFILIEIR